MIVPSMNTQQVYTEFLQGYSAVQRKINSLSSKFRRLAIRKRSNFLTLDYTDPQKNKWCIHVIFNKNSYTTLPFLYYHGNNGYQALRLHLETGECEAYNPHFFSRFNERVNIGSKSSMETMKAYFLMSFEVQVHQEKDNTFHAEIAVGVGLGYRITDYLIQYKTFLTHDMLRGQQISLSKKLRERMTENPAVNTILLELAKENITDVRLN